MQTKVYPEGQQSTEQYLADRRAEQMRAPCLDPPVRERVENAVAAAIVASLTQSLKGQDGLDRIIELAKKAVRDSLVPLTRAGG